ncbi:Bug family tripartite tricarboxylate transporter substrate binding protein [Bordetella genomosp. 10]|uniref:Bug family tripartite tricarboxylate transporter substrate binding protein n=1 Tax=Bordetella genomosp. 10 TaxID=1416804 RepID=UPI00211B229E|nr:tripartite tricarboxylate transporter substrate binding protein [Bordetella genomosp. 10]
MKTSRRTFIAYAVAAGMLGPGIARAAYPERPITIVVPLAAGGVTDIVARYVARELSQALKTSIVIENRLGAGGGVAAEYVARAAPDGYTLVAGTVSSHAINMSLYKNLTYNNLRDFAPVTMLAAGPNLLVVHPSLHVKTVDELIAYLKANPGKVSYGSTGVGTSTHVLAELFKMMTGTSMTHVPYKGSSQMMTDLIAGRVQLAFDNMPTALAQVRAGTLVPLGVTSAERWPKEPAIPTIAETLPKFVATSWQGLFAPAGTPPAIVERLSAEVRKILERPETVKRFRELGTNAVGMDPAAFTAFVREDTARWAKVVKESGASL